ncbi:MAG: hypothetical protein NTZ50_01970 [Chloroflexi bacterium]|nr:hypothetical protein [Chloroflexota bacterium]
MVNDEFDGAMLIDYVPWTALQSGTHRATKANDDPVACSGSGGKSVWCRIRVPAYQAIEVSTAGSSYDTVVGVYTGWPPFYTMVTCNDDWGGARSSQVAFTAYAYTDYYVVVTSYHADSGGDLQL